MTCKYAMLWAMTDWATVILRIRSWYYFRERLSKHNAEKSINLLEKAFEQITDAQIVELKVRTGMQRMDSTQIASNIVSASRLRLLVEAVQRVERILNAADRSRLSEALAPYRKDSAGQYTYRVKGKEAVQEHRQKIGQTIQALLQELKSDYAVETAYQILERIFAENFNLLEAGPRAKENIEIRSACLQSVDDLEATYRTKGTGPYKGYVANITETCDPENEIQLITKVQVAPNHVDDGQLLAEALPNLKERSAIETMLTDGGYGSAVSDETLQEPEGTLMQTAIRGAQPNPNKFSLSDFNLQQDEKGKPTTLTGPQGQTVPVRPGRTTGWQARFDPEICVNCPFQLNGQCRTQPQKRDPRYLTTFTTHEMRAAKRRMNYLAHPDHSHNLRSAVEATVRSLKHPFPAGKLPVRGQFRVTCMAIASAATTNVRRIQRYLTTKIKQAEAAKRLQSEAVPATAVSFFVFSVRWLRSRLVFFPIFGY